MLPHAYSYYILNSRPRGEAQIPIYGLVCFAVKAQKKNLISLAPFWVVSHCLTGVSRLQFLHASLSCTSHIILHLHPSKFKKFNQGCFLLIFMANLGTYLYLLSWILNTCVDNIHLVHSIYIFANFSLPFPPSVSSSALTFILIVGTGRLLKAASINSF